MNVRNEKLRKEDVAVMSGRIIKKQKRKRSTKNRKDKMSTKVRREKKLEI